MAIVDRRGNVITATSPASGAQPNPDLAVKAPVRVATVGASITLSGLQTLDGVTLAAGDRVLVKDQTSAAQNGIYVAASGAWSYAIDFVTAGLVQGTLVDVAQGNVNAGALFELSSPAAPITPGTSAIAFTSAAVPMCLEGIFDGGGAALAVGEGAIQIEVPTHFTLKRWTLLANRSGSFTTDIWNGPFSGLPLSAANSITGNAGPSLSNQQFAQSSNLAGWTTQILAGSVIVLPVLSVSLISEVTLSLYGTRP